MIYILVVVFLHRGLLHNVPSMHIEKQRFASFEDCAYRADEMRAAYSDYFDARCIAVKVTK